MIQYIKPQERLYILWSIKLLPQLNKIMVNLRIKNKHKQPDIVYKMTMLPFSNNTSEYIMAPRHKRQVVYLQPFSVYWTGAPDHWVEAYRSLLTLPEYWSGKSDNGVCILSSYGGDNKNEGRGIIKDQASVLTLKRLGLFFQYVILFPNVIQQKCNIFI